MIKLIFLFLFFIHGCHFFKKQDDKKDKKEDLPPQVVVKTIVKEWIFDPLLFAGVISPVNRSIIYAPIDGTVIKKLVNEGSFVNKNQSIMILKPHNTGFDYHEHIVKASRSGTLVYLEALENKIEQKQKIVEIADLSAFETVVQATLNDTFLIKEKETVAVILAPGTQAETTVGGTISLISPQLSSDTLTYPVHVVIECGKQSPCYDKIKIGAFVKVFVKKNPHNSYRIPLEYIHKNNTEMITVDENHKAKWKKIKIGRPLGEDVEVIEGLDGVKEIITYSSKKPKEDESVVVIEAK